jgi:hypothetical protein
MKVLPRKTRATGGAQDGARDGQLAEAERTADAARLAMPGLNIKIRKARTSSSDAIAAVRLAVVSVLSDELARFDDANASLALSSAEDRPY